MSEKTVVSLATDCIDSWLDDNFEQFIKDECGSINDMVIDAIDTAVDKAIDKVDFDTIFGDKFVEILDKGNQLSIACVTIENAILKGVNKYLEIHGEEQEGTRRHVDILTHDVNNLRTDIVGITDELNAFKRKYGQLNDRYTGLKVSHWMLWVIMFAVGIVSIVSNLR